MFVEIDLLVKLIRTRSGVRYLLVFTDRFAKLVRKIPLKNITDTEVARAFFYHYVFVYVRTT